MKAGYTIDNNMDFSYSHVISVANFHGINEVYNLPVHKSHSSAKKETKKSNDIGIWKPKQK